MSIDEQRRMFRLNRWTPLQPFVANPFDKGAPTEQQDIKQVWFAGVHADIGGGYPEAEGAISKYPLAWMIDQAVGHGLKINTVTKNELVLGHVRAGHKDQYIAKPLARVKSRLKYQGVTSHKCGEPRITNAASPICQ
jgi:uncharacterized protein (DUF2235 family)